MVNEADIVYTDLNRDYPKGYVKGALTIQKVRNACRKVGLEVAEGSNIRLNNVRTGCDGFIKDPTTGLHVYFHHEGDTYYREAYGVKDYTGGRNRFCKSSELVDCVKEMLDNAHGLKKGMRWGYEWSDKAILDRDIP